MSRHNLTRRGFLKLAGATGVAASAGITGIPSPLKAAQSNDAKSEMFLHYDRGVQSPSFCEMCFWNCGLNVYTRNGRIHKLEGNPLNPNSNGHLCAKGNSGIDSTYDADRIQHPLIRVGKRGEGKFKKVSWEEASQYVFDKLSPLMKKYGPETLATFMHGTGEPYVHALTKALGSPNIVVPAYSQCLGSREMAWILTFGTGVSGHETYDMANTRHMILFGRNMAGALQVREAEDFAEGLARGAKLTYVDPRLSESCVNATDWLQINPGTDLALALGFIHVIIRDNLVNMDFVSKYCYGFDQLSAHVAQYTPDWASNKCGIDAKTIERIAWDFAKYAPHVVAVPPRRMTRYGNDTQTVRAIAILNALMGNWGVPGGLWVRSGVPIDLPEYEEPKQPTTRRADGAGKGEKYPLAPQNLGRTNGMIEATLTQKPYPIKAWMLYGTNPLFHSSAGTNDIYKAIENLDLLIAIDTQFSDTVMYADVVFPESTYLERDDAPFVQKDKIPFIALREAAIKPIYDTKGCFDICKGIAEKFKIAHWFEHSPTQQIADLYKALSPEQAKKLKDDGVLRFEAVDPYPLASGATPTFRTATGKVQLYVPNLTDFYQEHGDDFAPMPIYKDPIMADSKDTFRLLFGKSPRHTHARTQNNWLLLELQDDNPIWIHPKDAKRLGFSDGQMVYMVNPKTGVKAEHAEKIKVTKRIKEGAVFIHHGFGHTTKAWSRGYEKGIGDNFFVSDDIDPISGAAAFNNGFVTLVKA
ncbi:molybdopterin-dependent oxidoreductase [Sulfurospirillum sp. 1612]|uniref:molybdopterin-dependent oxidoreductase n=1 Tax=Sulfurospirillum sp. 1612 TaxID=3094835 RepID=UPI002F934C73